MKDISVENRKTEIINEIYKLTIHNFYHRASYLCDDNNAINKLADLFLEYEYLINLQNKIKK